MIKEAIAKLINKADLSRDEMEQAFTQIMSGDATPAQIGAFITALRIKGETIDEITAAATIMRKFATSLTINDTVILDTCGTGGSGKHTFNISTIVALIASGSGITVAKHGNRSVSSKSGSADLFERLGVNIAAAPLIVERCINEAGIGFVFAPTFHKAMKHAIGPRIEIGIRTIFNLLGPLTNPAQATHQILGVFSESIIEPMANVLLNLGLKHAMVVHSQEGLDELSTSADNIICEVNNGKIKKYVLRCENLGIRRTNIENIQIQNVEESYTIATALLNGTAGPIRDVVLLNAAAAIYVADAATSLEDGLEIARKSLTEYNAREKLEQLKKLSNAIDS